MDSASVLVYMVTSDAPWFSCDVHLEMQQQQPQHSAPEKQEEDVLGKMCSTKASSIGGMFAFHKHACKYQGQCSINILYHGQRDEGRKSSQGVLGKVDYCCYLELTRDNCRGQIK